MSLGTKLAEPRAPMLLPAEQAGEIEGVLRTLRELTAPGEPIFVAPYAPIFYFLAERPNPTRYDLLFPGPSSSRERQREIIEALERASVRVIVIDDLQRDGQRDRQFPVYAPDFAAYLYGEFETYERFGRWIIYVRR